MAAGTHRRFSTLARGGASMLVAGMVLLGCGDSDAETDTSDPVTDTVPESAPVDVAEGVAELLDNPMDHPLDGAVILLDRSGELGYALGPAELTGEIVESAQVRFDTAWMVDVRLTAEGADAFGVMAAANFGRQVAIVVDGAVISAPTINATEFGRELVISGVFTQAEAQDLAATLGNGVVNRLAFRPVMLSFDPGEGSDETLAALREFGAS